MYSDFHFFQVKFSKNVQLVRQPCLNPQLVELGYTTTTTYPMSSHERGQGRVECKQTLPLPWEVERLFPIDTRLDIISASFGISYIFFTKQQNSIKITPLHTYHINLNQNYKTLGRYRLTLPLTS